MSKTKTDDEQPPGLGWRTSLTIVVSIGWLIFLILLFFFFTIGASLYQNIGLALLSTLILVVILVPVWVPWGLKQGRGAQEITRIPGFKWRTSLSFAVAVVWLAVFTIWFYFFADLFTLYQNLGVITLSIAIVAVVVGLTMRPMWEEYAGPMFKRRFVAAAAVGLAISVFLFGWLFFYADGYTFYQNVAIVAVPLTLWSLAQSLAGQHKTKDKAALSVGRIALGAIVSLGWMAFAFVWFFYYAQAYTLFENAVIFFVSIIIMGVMHGIIRTPQPKAAEKAGLTWRVALSTVMGVGWVAFIIIWLLQYASGYSVFQNMAIIVVSILVVAAVLGAAWAPWGMRQARKAERK